MSQGSLNIYYIYICKHIHSKIRNPHENTILISADNHIVVAGLYNDIFHYPFYILFTPSKHLSWLCCFAW